MNQYLMTFLIVEMYDLFNDESTPENENCVIIYSSLPTLFLMPKKAVFCERLEFLYSKNNYK